MRRSKSILSHTVATLAFIVAGSGAKSQSGPTPPSTEASSESLFSESSVLREMGQAAGEASPLLGSPLTSGMIECNQPSCATCEPLCDCCPEWAYYGELDFLLMSRSNGLRDQPLVLDADDTTQVLSSTGDLNFGVAPGIRAILGHRNNNAFGWELAYTGIYTAFADDAFSSEDNLSVPGDLGNLPGWGTADYIDPVYKSSLNLFDANLMWSTCCSGCEPDAWLAWKRYKHCTCTDLMAGVIWAGLNESADYNVICCEGDPMSSYSVDTASNLFGLQLGIRRRADWRCWSLEGFLKAAVAGSYLQSDSSAIYSTLGQSGDPNDPLVTARDPISLSGGGVSGIFQFNLTAIYRITPQWGLRGGYNLIGLTNVALAPDQWDFTDTPDSGRKLDGSGDILFHGVNLGVEYRW